jgi:hypothetical protein
MDLLKWQILASEHHGVLPVIFELADRLEPEHGIEVRNIRKRDFARRRSGRSWRSTTPRGSATGGSSR